MGRFNHEAAAVDPATGIVYMTEDRDDSVLLSLPSQRGRAGLAEGGRLQAMVIDGLSDTRNWDTPAMPVGQSYRVKLGSIWTMSRRPQTICACAPQPRAQA